MIININGDLFSENEAKISVLDRGFLFGDSIYEVTDARDNKPHFMEEHLDRLWESAHKIDMEIPYTKDFISNEVLKTLTKLNEERAYIRIIITRGIGEISLSPESSNNHNLVIISKKLDKNPDWWYEKGVEVIIAKTRRTAPDSIDPSIKSGNYLNNVMAYNEAVKKDVFDAIMLNHDNQITEGTTSNIWMVKDGQFITPPIQAGILQGITRKTLINLLKDLKIPVIEKPIKKEDIFSADEVFLTSSTRKIVPVIKIDDFIIGTGSPGEYSKKLLINYKKYLKQRRDN